MRGVLFDLRLACRGLARDRAFAVTTIATLAIAIALNVTVFTVRDAMLFRGLPQATRSDRLVYLAMRQPTDLACCPGPITYADFQIWRAQARSFEGLALRRSGEPISFRIGDNRPTDMLMTRGTTNLFALLGITPMLGRDFVEPDGLEGAPAVAIVSHQFWQRRLAGREDIVGLTVHISGTPATIVGVLPERFALVHEQDLFMPLTQTTAVEGGGIGRLQDGVTLAEARAELISITQAIQAADPAIVRGVPSVGTYSQAHVAPDAPRIYGVLWAGAWFVLLIACANLANLTMVRTIGRWREFTTRAALGAGLPSMVRQIAIEHLALASVAAAVAAGLTIWSVRTWADATASPYLALDYRVTGGTVSYLVIISAIAAALIALPPIARILSLGAGDAFRTDARGVTPGRRGKRLSATLVAVQMGLAIVLVSGAGILVRSLENIVGADTGVNDAERVTVGLLGLPTDKYPTPDARAAFFDRVEARLRTIAGVEEFTIASTFPTRMVRARPMEIEDRASVPAGDQVQVLSIAPKYFRAVGRPLVDGRDFTTEDDAAAPPVVLVNESFVAAFLPGHQAVGKRLRMMDGGMSGPWRTIVGVVPNIMQGDPTRQDFKPVIYAPFKQQPAARAFIVVRARRAADQIAHAAIAEVRDLDADVITEQFGSLTAKFGFDRDFMDLEHADLGKHAMIAPIFAVVAFVLAIVGVIAVVAHSVSQRTKEIGVRIAIGAMASDIVRMITREGMRPVAAGLLAGCASAFGTNRLLQSQLVGVSPYDPLTMIATPLILAAVAVLACRLPARKASRVNPMVALRLE